MTSDGGPRALLLKMFETAVAAAHPSCCLTPHLPPPGKGRIKVVGAGKAAAAMAVATEQFYCRNGHIGSNVGDPDVLSGFVTTRHGYGLPTDHIEIMEAGHPIPDAMSLAAAERALRVGDSAVEGDLVLCLLSGGASALWAAPVAGLDLAGKQGLTRALLKAGARIGEMNCVRKHLSRIKGGKLARAVYPALLLTLAISDVPGDDPSTIGSGPTVPDPTTLADARAILRRYGLDRPDLVAQLSNSENETPKPGDERLRTAAYKLIASPRMALEAAKAVAESAGYEVEFLGDTLEGEARDVGGEHAVLARAARERGRRVAILSGGELTVTVRGNGMGGPNQEYVLALALALDGAPGISALAADTDGADGGAGKPDDPAGAIAMPDTLGRARGIDLNAATFLANNDSTGFFSRLGDLVKSGPTQTNVNDLRVILVDP